MKQNARFTVSVSLNEVEYDMYLKLKEINIKTKDIFCSGMRFYQHDLISTEAEVSHG